MKRLRHPITSLREPFGKAGLTVAILALVLAMVGGAYAAGGLTKSQEKQVTKIAKKFAGKPGANGTNGTNGSPGAKGDAGSAGGAGAAGKSVVTSAAVPGECQTGTTGTKLEVEGSGTHSAVCNGKNGAPGLEGPSGQPWTTGGTLPASTEEGCPCTETGSWTISQYVDGELETLNAFAPISFTIPLAQEIESAKAHYVTVAEQGGGAPAECQGSPEAPTAAPGSLCVYETFSQFGYNGIGGQNNPPAFTGLILNPSQSSFAFGAATTGALVGASLTASETTAHEIESIHGQQLALGTWAVTAE